MAEIKDTVTAVAEPLRAVAQAKIRARYLDDLNEEIVELGFDDILVTTRDRAPLNVWCMRCSVSAFVTNEDGCRCLPGDSRAGYTTTGREINADRRKAQAVSVSGLSDPLWHRDPRTGTVRQILLEPWAETARRLFQAVPDVLVPPLKDEELEKTFVGMVEKACGGNVSKMTVIDIKALMREMHELGARAQLGDPGKVWLAATAGTKTAGTKMLPVAPIEPGTPHAVAEEKPEYSTLAHPPAGIGGIGNRARIDLEAETTGRGYVVRDNQVILVHRFAYTDGRATEWSCPGGTATAGDRIYIPETWPMGGKYYAARHGDTLQTIGERFGVLDRPRWAIEFQELNLGRCRAVVSPDERIYATEAQAREAWLADVGRNHLRQVDPGAHARGEGFAVLDRVVTRVRRSLGEWRVDAVDAPGRALVPPDHRIYADHAEAVRDADGGQQIYAITSEEAAFVARKQEKRLDVRKIDAAAEKSGLGYYADGKYIHEVRRIGAHWYQSQHVVPTVKVPYDAWIFETLERALSTYHGSIAAAVAEESMVAVVVEKELVMDAKKNDEGFMATTVSRAKGALLAEVPEAGWRLAARKAVERSPTPVLKALVKAKVITASTSKGIAEFLKSDLGSGLYGLGLGTLMTLHPRAAAKPWIGTLASQMRTEGLVRLGSTLVDPLFDAIEGIFSGLLMDVGIDIREPLQMGAPAPPISESFRDAPTQTVGQQEQAASGNGTTRS